ncbi:MAG: hypothetical protein AB1411_15995 [Nitrospirota bacterium]
MMTLCWMGNRMTVGAADRKPLARIFRRFKWVRRRSFMPASVSQMVNLLSLERRRH